MCRFPGWPWPTLLITQRMPEDRLTVEQTGVSASCLGQNPVSHLRPPSFSGFEAFVGKSEAQTQRIKASFHGNIMQIETGSSGEAELVCVVCSRVLSPFGGFTPQPQARVDAAGVKPGLQNAAGAPTQRCSHCSSQRRPLRSDPASVRWHLYDLAPPPSLNTPLTLTRSSQHAAGKSVFGLVGLGSDYPPVN